MVMESLERLSPPRRLGKFNLLARLGEGGMASVYLAAVGTGPLARLAAVKLLRAGAPDHDYRQRFVDEAKVVVRLHHNNLVDVREAGEVDGQLFIAMELVEGRDLGDVWDRCADIGRAFPIPLAVYLVREILRGLHYAHGVGELALVHRDISPSNVLLDWAGAVRLADFGLATSAMKAAMTVPGLVFGKVGYMAPEQATRAELDKRADVYSCAVVLWELCTGRPLRGAEADTKSVARFSAPNASDFSRRVDPWLDQVIANGLRSRPEDRYPDARVFMELLSAWLAKHAPQTNQESVAAFMAGLFPHAADNDRRLHSELLVEGAPAKVWGRTSSPIRRPTHAALEGDTGGAEAIPHGTILADRYRIDQTIGHGGMGTVYLGEHLLVGRKVAVKVLTHEWSSHPIVAARFKDEARAASLAGHPSIVEVFDAGQIDDGRLYIVMEYLTGRTLFEELRACGSLPLARACRIVRDVARAIHAAHDVGIIHRDLKPDNVMLVPRRRDEVVKVLDFGISASAVRTPEEARLTRPGHCLGTPEYMAPEQARGAPADVRFDVYALGVMLYELLAGEPPFASDNMVEVLARKATEPAPLLTSRVDGIPPAVAALVHACIALDPGARPQSAAVVADRLDEIGIALASGTVHALQAASEFDRGPATAPVLLRPRGEPMQPPLPGTSKPARASHVRWFWWVTVIAAASVGIALRVWASQPIEPLEARLGLAEATAPPKLAATAAWAPIYRAARVPDPPAAAVETVTSSRAAPKRSAKRSKRSTRSVKRPRAAPPDTLACEHTREDAQVALGRHEWNRVLALTRASSCFGGVHRKAYLQMRVEALFQVGQFAACVEFGEGVGDPRVQARAADCRRRAS